MADFPQSDVGSRSPAGSDALTARDAARLYSFALLLAAVRRRRFFFFSVIGGMLVLCGVYCLIAPNQYEASARVAQRMQNTSSLSVDAAEPIAPLSFLNAPLQLETLVNVLRSERLEWRVIQEKKLYANATFSRSFAGRFPKFDVANPAPEERGYLLETFNKKLQVRTMPRTFLIEVKFRSKDPVLSADVVNALIRTYMAAESETRSEDTQEASGWLAGQLQALTVELEQKERLLAEFERKHGFTTIEQTVPGGQPVETLHDPTAMQVDEAGRLLAAASGDRILREALYKEAQLGRPELVLAANPELQAEMGPGGATMLQQLRAKASDAAVELAQLKAEHGPNYPRVVELGRAQADIEAQIAAEDANLIEAFKRTWQSAVAREQLLRGQLDARMAEGLRQNDAVIQYSVMHQDVEAGREICTRLRKRVQEARYAAGLHASSIQVVDWARVPYKPVAPDPVLYFAVTLFVGFWVALVGALGLDVWRPVAGKAAAVLLLLMSAGIGWTQAPTPNTSGLPSGVVKLPLDSPATRTTPNPKDAPPVWNAGQAGPVVGDLTSVPAVRGLAMALPVGVGDFLEVSEFHTPEFHTAVRVNADGTVLLPLIGQVRLVGLSEQEASRAIEKSFVDAGMLLHPQVSVLVTAAVGQDVSVMGEVARPGVYAYTAHHRLLDLIAAASGLTSNAGRLVSVFHRDDAKTAHPVVLDPTGTAPDRVTTPGAAKEEHNPELEPGDTVLVSRAGLAYVIGDVVRPGGFAVDPVQGLTVVQALSLAWGASPNAAVGKAILIRDQAGGRTLTTLNLKRMIRGQDPDQPVRDKDILFIPDSAAKTLLNKSLESAIQSAIGVTIYAGLVYSQRF